MGNVRVNVSQETYKGGVADRAELCPSGHCDGPCLLSRSVPWTSVVNVVQACTPDRLTFRARSRAGLAMKCEDTTKWILGTMAGRPLSAAPQPEPEHASPWRYQFEMNALGIAATVCIFKMSMRVSNLESELSTLRLDTAKLMKNETVSQDLLGSYSDLMKRLNNLEYAKLQHAVRVQYCCPPPYVCSHPRVSCCSPRACLSACNVSRALPQEPEGESNASLHEADDTLRISRELLASHPVPVPAGQEEQCCREIEQVASALQIQTGALELQRAGAFEGDAESKTADAALAVLYAFLNRGRAFEKVSDIPCGQSLITLVFQPGSDMATQSHSLGLAATPAATPGGLVTALRAAAAKVSSQACHQHTQPFSVRSSTTYIGAAHDTCSLCES